MYRIKILIAIICCFVGFGFGHCQLFYRLISPEGGESHIFGTHHLAPLSVADSIPGLHDALDNSGCVVVEVDMISDPISIGTTLQKYMTAPADSTLSRVLSREDWDTVSKVFEEYSPMPGFEIQMFDSMKPTVIGAMIALGVIKADMPGYQAGEQLDTYFQEEASLNGKPIITLESIDDQGRILYSSQSVKAQADALVELAKDPEETARQASMLNAAYLEGNLDILYSMVRDAEKDKELYDKLLFDRNRAWLAKLPDILNQGGAFVAVGALHLPGPEGLLQSLRQLGYKIEPVE